MSENGRLLRTTYSMYRIGSSVTEAEVQLRVSAVYCG
jgi:hypothetical protein